MVAATQSRLSLRLWAAPHAERALGKCALFEHADGVVLVIDERGIAAIATEAPGREPDAAGLVQGTEPEGWPPLQLVRQADGGAVWLAWAPGEPNPRRLQRAELLEVKRGPLTAAVCRSAP